MNPRGLVLFARYPAMLPALLAVAIVSWSVMTWAEHRWNRPPKPKPRPRYRLKPRTASMRGRR